ncbi:BRO family protein [uncultured Pseudomonas sp.]|uniref:BRO-N domain-containing protein n=1 Tax=uncultured Pseudomonas sp. TaxID=114707 RepID=UPI0025D79B0F|nr:BRO family protein [uncultured Pseudomonas sp.]
MNNFEAIHVENHSTNVIPFKFDQREVRTLLIDGEPWFVAADACGSIGIANVSLAVNGRADREGDGLDADERGIATVNTPSGDQEMLVVNESGLYSLIFKSRKVEAKRFRKWVTAEVLPAIRKHGRYEDEKRKMPTLVNELIGMSELNVIKGTIRDKAKDVAAAKRRSFHAAMCSRLHTRFNVPRLEMIPADQFEAACNFIAAYALEGEWIEAKKPVSVIGLSDYEAQAVHLLICHSKQLVKMVDEIYRAGGALRSDLLISVASHLWEIRAFLGMLDRQKAGELAKLHEQRMSPARRAAA